jgi:hypothetical protein
MPLLFTHSGIAAGQMTVLAAIEWRLQREYERLGARALDIWRRMAYRAGTPGSPPAGRGHACGCLPGQCGADTAEDPLSKAPRPVMLEPWLG